MHLCAYAVDTKEVNVANRARAVEPKSFGEIVVTGLQSKQVVVVPVTTRAFSAKTEAIGYIDFNLDKTVQIFAPYAGKIRQVFAKSGDNVKAGQALSPSIARSWSKQNQHSSQLPVCGRSH